jgi:hypothetical protein
LIPWLLEINRRKADHGRAKCGITYLTPFVHLDVGASHHGTPAISPTSLN